MAEVIGQNPQFYSHDTRCYSIVSFHPWENNRLALQTAYMLGLVFIRTSGTFLAHALRYWQRSTAHSTSGEANITNHLLLSDGSAPASACLASNHSHLLSLSFSSLSQKRPGSAYPTSDWQLGPRHGLFACGTSVLYWLGVLMSDGDLMSVEICGHASEWISAQCGQTALLLSSGWAAGAACCILKALTVSCLFIKLFMALVQIY